MHLLLLKCDDWESLYTSKDRVKFLKLMENHNLDLSDVLNHLVFNSVDSFFRLWVKDEEFPMYNDAFPPEVDWIFVNEHFK